MTTELLSHETRMLLESQRIARSAHVTVTVGWYQLLTGLQQAVMTGDASRFSEWDATHLEKLAALIRERIKETQ